MTKRLLSFLLAVIMVCSLLPVPTLAAGEEPSACNHNLVTKVSADREFKLIESPDGNPAYELALVDANLGERVVEMEITNLREARTINLSWYRERSFPQYGLYIITFYLDGNKIEGVGGDYTNVDDYDDTTGWMTAQVTIPATTDDKPVHTLKFSVNKTGYAEWREDENTHAIEIPFISAFNAEGVCSLCDESCPHETFFQNFDTENHWLECTQTDGCRAEIYGTKAPHTYDGNGNCTGCAYSMLTFLDKTTVQISNAQQLLSFANLVNVNHQTKLSATLTDDINMKGITTFTPIGTEQYPYEGKIDGRGHRIMNLNLNLPDSEYVGLLGAIRGAAVWNIVMDKSCSFVGKSKVAPFGWEAGVGPITFINVGNEANVTAMEDYAVGLVAHDGAGSATLFGNCYVKANITAKSGNHVGGITNNTFGVSFQNAYFAGDIKGSVELTRSAYYDYGLFDRVDNDPYEDFTPETKYIIGKTYAPGNADLTNGTLLNTINKNKVQLNLYVRFDPQFKAGTTHPILYAEPAVIIDPHEHSYVITYEWHDDGTECKAVAVCSKAGCMVEGNCIEETAAATSEFIGMIEGTSIAEYKHTAVFANALFTTQQKYMNVTVELPELVFSDVDGDTFTVSWEPFEDAVQYVVDVYLFADVNCTLDAYSGYRTEETSLTVKTSLAEFTHYVRVRPMNMDGVIGTTAKTGSVTTIHTSPDVSSHSTQEASTLLLNHYSYEVLELDVALVSLNDRTYIENWDEMVAAGLQFTAVNGKDGYKKYENPEDELLLPQSVSGYYLSRIKYIGDDNEVHEKYTETLMFVPSCPIISTNSNNIVVTIYDDAVEVHDLYIAYIGTESKEIADWDSFVEAGKDFTDINGADGYKQYSDAVDGAKYPQNTVGFYAVFCNYNYGDSYTKCDVVEVETVPVKLPELVFSDVDANTFTVSWEPFGDASKYVLDLAFDADFNSIWSIYWNREIEGTSLTVNFLTIDSTYYVRVRPVDKDDMVITGSVRTVPTAPRMTTEDRDKLVLNHYSYEVIELDVALVSLSTRTFIENWDEMVAAGLQYPAVNGKDGYKKYENPEDGLRLPQPIGGFYLCRIEYIGDDGEVHEKYTELCLFLPSWPIVSVDSINIVLNYYGCAVNELFIAYIGTEAKEITDWESFLAAGEKFTNINGEEGYKQYNNPEDGATFAQNTSGFYAVFTNYSIEDKNPSKCDVVEVEMPPAPSAPPVPFASAVGNKIVLSHNDCSVKKMSIGYIGAEDKEINDWAAFDAACKPFGGYKQYSNPVDGKEVVMMDSGYYAVYIRYEQDGETLTTYQTVYIEAAQKPEASAQGNKIVLSHNDCSVLKMSIGYIGTEDKEINDWAAFDAASKPFGGYKQYSNPVDGKQVVMMDSGYYAVYIRYEQDGEIFTTYQTVCIEAAQKPEATVQGYSIVVNKNDTTLEKVTIAFIGTEHKEINDWAAFDAASKAFGGYKQFGSPADGAAFPQYTTGFYAVYIRYNVDGQTCVKYQVLELTAPNAPEVFEKQGHIGISFNGCSFGKLSLAYIGTEPKVITNWSEFEAAGKAFASVNGSVGCTHHTGIEDGKLLEVFHSGYYAAFIRYTVDGETVTKYQVVYLEAADLPSVTAGEGKLTVNHNDFTVGKQFPEINGAAGYQQYGSPADGKEIALDVAGYYVAYIRYDVDGAKVVRYMTVHVDAKDAPSASVSGRTILLEKNGFNVTKVSGAFIGFEYQNIKTWSAFASAGKKFTNLNGPEGYLQFNNPADDFGLTMINKGFYALYIRYIEDGATVVRYQVVEIK